MEIGLLALLALIWVCIVLLCIIPAGEGRRSAESKDKK